MKKLLITLAAAAPCFAHADPFTTYETENNAGAQEISVFSSEMNKFYHDSLYNIDTPVYEFGEMFSEAKPDRKAPLEPIHFAHARWSTEKPSIGLAQYSLPKLDVSGWMVFETDATGKVADLYWTQTPDRHTRHSAELAQAGDVATTLLDVGAEANPVVNAVGLGPIAVLKIAAPSLAKHYGSFSTCASIHDSAQDFGWFATVNNPVAVATAAPVSLVLGTVAYAVSAQHHNGFWECLPDDLRN